MTDSARYAKIVEWSEEDQCFVGSSPGLIYGGCHGQDEREVFDHLCQIVEEARSTKRTGGRYLRPRLAETSPTRCRMSPEPITAVTTARLSRG